MRPSRLTLRLLVAVLLAGGLVYFLERRVPSTDDLREKGRKAFQVDARAVAGIEVEQGGVTLSATLNQGVWMLSKPPGMRADTAQVHRLLDRIEKIGRGALLTMEDIRARNMTYNDFGLADPIARITLHLERSRREILIGRNTPLGKEVYVMEAGGRNVMSVESDLLDILPKDPHLWRDRRVFPCDPKDFTRLELRRPSGFVELARNETGAWEIRQPVSGRVLPEGIGRLLQLLGTLRVEKFVSDENPASGGFGFEEERHVLRAWMEGHPFPLRLTLGKAIEGEKNLLYARVDGIMAVFAVSEGIRQLADYELDALRDRKLLTQDIRGLRQIRITGPDSSVRMDRSADGRQWTLEEPVKHPAGVLQIGQVVKLWKEGVIAHFLRDADGAEGQAPLYTIEFAGDDNALERFEVHATRAPDGAVVVHALHEDAWFAVVPEAIRHVSSRALDYRDHQVLALEPADILSLQRRSGTNAVSLVRASADAAWSAETNGVTTLSAAIDSLLTAASALNARRLVEADPRDLARYGLAEPSVAITFGLSGRSGLGRSLLLGTRAGDGETFAMIRGQDLVFVLADADLVPFLEPLVATAPTAAPAPPADAAP